MGMAKAHGCLESLGLLEERNILYQYPIIICETWHTFGVIPWSTTTQR